MMYAGMPSLTTEDRLSRGPVLDLSRARVDVSEAAVRVGVAPRRILLGCWETGRCIGSPAPAAGPRCTRIRGRRSTRSTPKRPWQSPVALRPSTRRPRATTPGCGTRPVDVAEPRVLSPPSGASGRRCRHRALRLGSHGRAGHADDPADPAVGLCGRRAALALFQAAALPRGAVERPGHLAVRLRVRALPVRAGLGAVAGRVVEGLPAPWRPVALALCRPDALAPLHGAGVWLGHLYLDVQRRAVDGPVELASRDRAHTGAA